MKSTTMIQKHSTLTPRYGNRAGLRPAPTYSALRTFAALRLCGLIFLLFFSFISYAQDEVPEASSNRIVYGEVVTGEITSRSPREVYTFEGLRCDFLNLRVTATGGDLDPIVTVLDETGAPVFSGDDTAGTENVIYEPVAIPRSGIYSVVVGRFGYSLGTTTGTYELLIEQIGNGSSHGCAMRYGNTVVNAISNMQSQFIYSFRARQGDIVNIRMEGRSGDLDPYLTVTDNSGLILEYNDDSLGSGTDAIVEALLIPDDGTYYIIASRYGLEAGKSTGNFVLTLQEATNSGLGNSALAAIPIRIGAAVEGELSATKFANYYRFEAQQNDILTVTMDRLSSNLDAFLVLATADLREIAFNDDSRESQNAMIDAFLIPADGTYYIIATRFDREAGTTAGRYRLELSDEGNAFEDVPSEIRRISYGTVNTGTLDDVTPEVFFAFYGTEDDKITVSLNRGDGDLDPTVSILASDRVSTYVSDDDSGDGQNARIAEFTLPYTGIYYIRAARFTGQDNPGTEGSYVLILAQQFGE